MKSLLLVAVLGLNLDWVFAPATPGFPRHLTLRPVDESALAADFKAFHQQLKTIVQKKDARALYGLMVTDLKCSFGMENGREGCFKMWGLDKKPQNAPIWRELQALLELGGQFERNNGKPKYTQFIAPYTYSADAGVPHQDYYGFITAAQVKAYQKPQTTSPLVARLAYNVVEILAEMPAPAGGFPWYKIVTPQGAVAYVEGQYLRSNFAYRAFFEKTPQGWRIGLLIAGD